MSACKTLNPCERMNLEEGSSDFLEWQAHILTVWKKSLPLTHGRSDGVGVDGGTKNNKRHGGHLFHNDNS